MTEYGHVLGQGADGGYERVHTMHGATNAIADFEMERRFYFRTNSDDDAYQVEAGGCAGRRESTDPAYCWFLSSAVHNVLIMIHFRDDGVERDGVGFHEHHI